MAEEWDSFRREVNDHAKIPGIKCRVGVMLETLPSDARREVIGVLADGDSSHGAIHRALHARLGAAAPSRESVANHRRGKCRCSR